MTESELRHLIAGGETLTVEFKSDQGPLSDTDLVEAVVCLANGQGGRLLIGVENDGRVTGLHLKHHSHPAVLAAFIASRTVPPLTVEAEFVTLSEGLVAVVVVPAARQPISTSDGRLVARYRDMHNHPACRPLYAYELTNWLAERGQADATALIVPHAAWEDLDPVEFARLRRMIEETPGDAALLRLSDVEIARAMRLTRQEDGRMIPTVAGLLLVGKETALREHVPAHEVAFQVLHGTDVAVNEFRRWPLLRVHEWLMEAIGVRNEEQELMMGAIRVGVSRYDRRGVREAINNALIHRDYTRLGAVHVQLHDDQVRISNPGGFVVGVHPDNLLVADPHPRNPTLADAFKRVGLVERTGRGVSIIYAGQVQNGRRPPDYRYSTEAGVLVVLDSGPANLDFVRLSIQANQRLGRALRVEELLTLWVTWHEGTVTPASLGPYVQQRTDDAAPLLVGLLRAGLLQAEDEAYRLAPERLRGAEIAPLPQEAILAHVQAHGRITRREASIVTGLTEEQTRYQLRKLAQRGDLEQIGGGRGTYYRLPETGKNGE